MIDKVWKALRIVVSAPKIREICIIKINFRGVIQKNDDLNRRFTEINMQSFFENASIYFLLFFIVEQTQANEHRL